MTGEQLKEWRQGKSLTRKQLGDEFGVSEHTVAKWEQGVNPIPRAVAKLVTQPPQLSFTLEEFGKLQDKAKESGRTVEQICIDLIKAGLTLIIAGLLAYHVIRVGAGPKAWTSGALSGTARAAWAQVAQLAR